MNRLLYILLLSHPIIANCQIIPAKTIYIDISQSPSPAELNKKGDSYYVIFAFHDSELDKNPDVNSKGGHAWVTWGKEDIVSKKSSIDAYGFYQNTDLTDNNKIPNSDIGIELKNQSPKNDLIFSNIINSGRNHTYNLNSLNVLLNGNSVAGKLRNDIAAGNKYNTVHQLVVKLDYKAYESSLKVLEKYKLNPPNYGYIRQDCVKFVIDVASSLGFDMPDRTLWTGYNTWFPSKYMHLFFSQILKSITITNDTNDEEEVSANTDGEYTFTEFESPFAGRMSKKMPDGTFMNGLFVGDKMRYGKFDYPTGDSYKLSTNPKYAFSEYIFKDGNILLDYDGKNHYKGEIKLQNGNIVVGFNQNGLPNGECDYYSIDPKDHAKCLYYTRATFTNGKFQQYASIQLPGGAYYGKLVNGLCEGKGKLYSADGKSFQGMFHLGYPTGQGNLTFPNGDILTCNFSNGKPNGDGQIKNGEKIIFDGHYADGQMSGRGRSVTKDGTVYVCEYVDGQAVSGRCIFPNGGSFTGTFKNGLPNKGSYYDSHGVKVDNKATREHESAASNRDFPSQNDSGNGKSNRTTVGNGKPSTDPLTMGPPQY